MKDIIRARNIIDIKKQVLWRKQMKISAKRLDALLCNIEKKIREQII